MPSLTFIRRELAALESQGWVVDRFAIRPSAGAVVDEDDIAEISRTRVILDERGASRLLRSVARQALRTPGALARAAREAVRLGRGGGLRARALPFAYLAEACVLAGWLGERDLDHVHTHFGTNGPAVALLARELCGATFSFTVHGPEEFDRPEALQLRQKIAAASFVVAISSYGRSQLMRWSDPDHWGRIHVVRCGLDHRYLTIDPPPIVEDPRFVCIGRLGEQKGQLVLIEAIARLRDDERPPRVVLVGDGPMRAAIEAAVESAGVGHLVTLAGWLDGDAVREELIRARALVLPSFAEGLPVAIMEALAMGRPVVTTAVAGVPELVDDRCGWVVPPGSVDDLVEALRAAMAATSTELELMGSEGRRRVLARHDVQTEAAVLAGHLTEAMT